MGRRVRVVAPLGLLKRPDCTLKAMKSSVTEHVIPAVVDPLAANRAKPAPRKACLGDFMGARIVLVIDDEKGKPGRLREGAFTVSEAATKQSRAKTAARDDTDRRSIDGAGDGPQGSRVTGLDYFLNLFI